MTFSWLLMGYTSGYHYYSLRYGHYNNFQRVILTGILLGPPAQKKRTIRATELIGYALESSDSQLSNAHHVIFVALLVLFLL